MAEATAPPRADNASESQSATFTAMTDGTREDWIRIARAQKQLIDGLPDRVLAHLRLLEGDFGGYAVDRLTHSLQTATRAERDGRDAEYVVCALLHDIGDTLAPFNHPALAATILKPFVSKENHFIVANHQDFQGYYYYHHLGMDRDARERFRRHEFFDATAEFCAKYDQNSFDPDYDTLPLEHFEDALRTVLTSRSFAVPE